jgi:hypothetical protein
LVCDASSKNKKKKAISFLVKTIAGGMVQRGFQRIKLAWQFTAVNNDAMHRKPDMTPPCKAARLYGIVIRSKATRGDNKHVPAKR